MKNAPAGYAHLERLHQHVRSFAKIMAQRRGTELPACLEAVEADDLPELRSFAAGIRRDLSAVINGLTLEQLRHCRGQRHTRQAAQARRLRTSQIRSPQSTNTHCRLSTVT